MAQHQLSPLWQVLDDLRHVRIARADDTGQPQASTPSHHKRSACMAAAPMQPAIKTNPLRPVYLGLCSRLAQRVANQRRPGG